MSGFPRGGGGGGTVTSVKATDTSIVVAGTAAAPTIATGTLDVIAAQHPPAAAVALNAQKITGLANGSAATDAAAFGQIPVAPPGTLLGVKTYAPSSVGTFSPNTSNITAYDTTNLTVAFTVPANGIILVRLTGTVNGPTAAAAHMVWGLLNHTGGALVGIGGLVYNSPTATVADDLAAVSFVQRIAGLAAGALQLDWGGLSNNAAMNLLAQGGTSISVTPTGGPATMEVWAAL